MGLTRVMVANELRSYRSALSEVIRRLCPDNVEVREVEPEDLDEAVVLFYPDLVVCSQVTSVVIEHVPVWVELHPNHAAHSTVCIQGEMETLESMELTDLLTLLKC